MLRGSTTKGEGKMNKLDILKYLLDSSDDLVATSAGDNSSGGWQIGKNYLIRTVTHIQTGRVVAIDDHEITVEDAAWIADTGRFSGALATAEFEEVEPFPEGQVIIGRGALIDAVQIPKLPMAQK